MNYLEQFKKRDELIAQADDIMNIYVRIADHLYTSRKDYSKYSSVIHMDISENGISYEYYYDNWDYTAGRGNFFVSKEELEALVDQYLRKEKLKNIERVTK